MAQGRTILIVALVGLGAAGTWVWQHNAAPSEVKVASAQTAPERAAPPPAPAVTPPATTEPAPAPSATPKPPTPAALAPDHEQGAVNTATPDVDTPEPAERKFAHGGRPATDEH